MPDFFKFKILSLAASFTLKTSNTENNVANNGIKRTIKEVSKDKSGKHVDPWRERSDS
jgi:hypothetical protein